MNAARTRRGTAPLSWTASLAQGAQSWAQGCVFQVGAGHLGASWSTALDGSRCLRGASLCLPDSPGERASRLLSLPCVCPPRLQHSNSGLGENLYRSSAPATCSDAVNMWLAEERYCPCTSFTQATGHYTQASPRDQAAAALPGRSRSLTKNCCLLPLRRSFGGEAPRWAAAGRAAAAACRSCAGTPRPATCWASLRPMCDHPPASPPRSHAALQIAIVLCWWKLLCAKGILARNGEGMHKCEEGGREVKTGSEKQERKSRLGGGGTQASAAPQGWKTLCSRATVPADGLGTKLRTQASRPLGKLGWPWRWQCDGCGASQGKARQATCLKGGKKRERGGQSRLQPGSGI